MKKIIFSFLALVLMILGVFVVQNSLNSSQDVIQVDRGSALVQGTSISLDVSDTSEERIMGLSGRQPYETFEEGMLFVFDRADTHGIWMKGMLFDLDIAWLDEEGVVIHTVLGAQPSSFPDTTFRPESPALFVLEMNAGAFAEIGIENGVAFDLSEAS